MSPLALNLNYSLTNGDLLHKIELVNENKSISFNRHLNSTKRLSIKGFGGNHFDKHCLSTVRLFIKVLAGLSLITTVIVL